MPKIGEVQRSGREALDIPGLPWLQEALHGGLVRGGIYLLAGEPGIGKTTLAVQILVDLAKRQAITFQQAAEKACKGWLIAHGWRPVKISGLRFSPQRAPQVRQ